MSSFAAQCGPTGELFACPVPVPIHPLFGGRVGATLDLHHVLIVCILGGRAKARPVAVRVATPLPSLPQVPNSACRFPFLGSLPQERYSGTKSAPKGDRHVSDVSRSHFTCRGPSMGDTDECMRRDCRAGRDDGLGNLASSGSLELP